MENQHGEADADFPDQWFECEPGYQTYLEVFGSRREAPSVLILASGEQAVLQVVRACGEVLGPVYHLSDPDHAAIRAEAARLEPGSALLAMTGGRLLLTIAGGDRCCPLCGVFAADGAAGWRSGTCPVLAGPANDPDDLLSGPILSALHVLIDEICGISRQADTDVPLGYSIELAARAPGGHGVRLAVELVGVFIYRGSRASFDCVDPGEQVRQYSRSLVRRASLSDG
jgi:hypothetical protein